MSGTFVVFDVETPNASNSRMSAIGLTVVEDGRIVDELFTLVNPETYFHPFNVALTGITPEMAERAPTFDQLWETIGPRMSSGLLVAHNAPFDMSVLAKCLRAYCIDWRDQTGYACTVQMSRRCWPQLPNHKLDTLCAYLDIPLDHHKADSDSRACAQILTACLDQGADMDRFRRTYDLRAIRTLPQSGRASPDFPKPAENRACNRRGKLI